MSIYIYLDIIFTKQILVWLTFVNMISIEIIFDMDVVLDSLQRIFDTNDVIIIISNDGFDQYYYDQWFEI